MNCSRKTKEIMDTFNLESVINDLPHRVNILGSEYKIKYLTEKESQTLCQYDGWCDSYKKEIVIEKTLFEDGITSKRGYEVLRHEIIHGFIFESGLSANCDWARNEELVDWIALQFPKLNKCLEKLV